LLPALLVSAFGLVFLFTSAKMKVKRFVLWLFGLSILLHAASLSLRGRYPFVDNVLMINGVVLMVLIGYMCYKIYSSFARKRQAHSR